MVNSVFDIVAFQHITVFLEKKVSAHVGGAISDDQWRVLHVRYCVTKNVADE